MICCCSSSIDVWFRAILVQGHATPTYLVTADACQEDGIGIAALLETFFGEGIILGINCGSTDEGLLEIDLESESDAKSLEDLLGGGGNFRANSIAGEEGHRVGILLADSVEGGGGTSSGGEGRRRSKRRGRMGQTEKDGRCGDRELHRCASASYVGPRSVWVDVPRGGYRQK